MSIVPWALASRRIVVDGLLRPGVVLVGADGRVVDVVETVDHVPAGYVLRDVGELAVSPGLVDCHVHINEPGRTDWEGYVTATRAAAAGGITSLVDMPLNCIPVTTSADALAQKLAACRAACAVDVGFWGGVVPGNAPLLDGLADGGVLGCKAFMVHSGIDDFPNVSESDLRAAMRILRARGLPLLAHAEIDLGAPTAQDPRAYAGYLASRPAAWEEAAITQLIALCRETGCHVHIVHLSAASALDMLRAAKAEGLPISVETCPHYLCLQAESIPDGATLYKCAPPIRERANCEALWQGLFDGVIDFVISDHSPCTPQLKLLDRGDFAAAWGGIASLQLGLPTLWTHARARGASLPQLARWQSEQPAKFAGLGTRKGRIAAGYDADLVVWDPEAELTVRAEDLFYRHKVSPYLGLSLRGQVQHTFLRGAEIYTAAGREHRDPPQGQLLLQRDQALGRS